MRQRSTLDCSAIEEEEGGGGGGISVAFYIIHGISYIIYSKKFK
jgi:hypothetical protein